MQQRYKSVNKHIHTMTRAWGNLLALLLSTSHRNCAIAPFCPATQRYDVAQFPPRCMDCPSIIPVQMNLTQINTMARTKRVLKFSPGLPQNQSCGCWRAPADQTIDVALNSSWIVSGLVFNTNRRQWLRQINVKASIDNRTFVDWGTYTAMNFTDASTTLFSYPIRAQFFKVTVLRYINHLVNDTQGVPLSVGALVSQTQPFKCECPQLSNGQCCPFVNMTVRNNTCMWCMDPTQLYTVMINGCGKCRLGTYEHHGRCLYSKPRTRRNSFTVSDAKSNGLFWTMGVNLSTDVNTALVVFLAKDNQTHPCAFDHATAQCLTADEAAFMPILREALGLAAPVSDNPYVADQYLQFDRGRYTLNMTQPTLRSWANCDDHSCRGYIGAAFVTVFENSGVVKTQSVMQAISFNFKVPNLILSVSGMQDTLLARLELHRFGNAWALRIIGVVFRGDCVHLEWDTEGWLTYDNTPDTEYKWIDPPPAKWDSLRVSDCIRTTTLRAQQPVAIITHDASFRTQHTGINIQIRYGFNFSETPTPGDSEQLVTITASSLHPIRLKRLTVATLAQGITTTYTNSKGFIIDPTRVVDLVVACTQPSTFLMTWITKAILILKDNPPSMISAFIQKSCALISQNKVSKAYWLAPARALTPRTIAHQMEVMAEFG